MDISKSSVGTAATATDTGASNSNNTTKKYEASTLTDEELARKAQEELNMEGEMEEVRENERKFE
jgi:hypothetical protein